MTLRSPRELRNSAKEFREMASAGADPPLRESLLQVADEFEAEADRLEGVTDQRGDRR
jgi:hypothetical protein